MNIRLSHLFLGLSLFVAACGDGSGETPPPPASAPMTVNTPPAAGEVAPVPSSPTIVAADAGTATDAAAPPPSAPVRSLAVHCTGPTAPTTNLICLETAEGRAGDIIELEVHLLRTAACGTAEYAFGAIQVDPAKFELVNKDFQQDCLDRSQDTSNNDPKLDIIRWQAFDRSVAPASCPVSAGIGKVDVLKVRIKPGTPPGDYDLPFESSEMLGGGFSCGGVFLDLAGKIRVLP